MITVDERAMDVAREKFNRAIATKISVTGLAARDCVIVETGRLTELLMKRTPPKDVSAATKLKGKIDKKVTRKFQRLTSRVNVSLHQTGGKFGRGSVCWIASTPTSLYGEMRDTQDVSDPNKLWGIFLGTNDAYAFGGRADYAIEGRGKQDVFIKGGYKVTKESVAALSKRLQRHVGRLKAGWLKAYRAAQSIGYRGSWQPQQYVLNNETGARGDFRNGTQDATKPFMDIINRARGVNQRYMRIIAKDALESRAKYMIRRLEQLVKHPELIGQEMTGEPSE